MRNKHNLIARRARHAVVVAMAATLAAAMLFPGLSAIAEGDAGNTAYLPVVSKPAASTPSPTPGPIGQYTRRVNAPYFNVPDVLETATFMQMAIFWFGQVTERDNYTDVRVGFNNDELVIYTATFDRLLYFDTTPSAGDLTNWDAVSLYLHQEGAPANTLTGKSLRVDVQYSESNSAQYQATYGGATGAWTPANVPVRTFTTYRGGSPNSGEEGNGWAAHIRVPFASLGISRPQEGTTWRIAVINHDRKESGSQSPRKTWPSAISDTDPTTWGVLHFGLPVYTPPSSSPGGTVEIRHRLNGATVTDANVGGYTVCGKDPAMYWKEWGTLTWADYVQPPQGDFNIQNQSDISDWPCFAKYYITFPLAQIPPGKVIRSATLTLHQFGNSQPRDATRSLIQLLSVGEDWPKATLNWNNAPLAVENVGRGWVDPLATSAAFPGVARTLDASYAVAQAYAVGQPLRLALYSADSDYHSGKYFVSSETGDWNAAGRPNLTVVWGNP